MIRKLIGNIKNIRSTVLGLSTFLITLGAAIAAFADGDASTRADWQAVVVAFSALTSSLWLIFASKD